MDRYAIDVVLVPDVTVHDLAIAVSRRLAEGQPDATLVLDDESMAPHISLGMAAVRVDEIVELTREIEDLAGHYRRPMLEIDRISVPGEGRSTLLEIAPSPDLQALHEHVVELLESFYICGDPEVTPGMFLGDVPAGASACRWVERYLADHSFDGFSPHLTVGVGDPGEVALPVTFHPQALAVYHLGPHCTCHQCLAWFDLS